MIKDIILAVGVLSLVNAPDGNPAEERKQRLLTFFNVDNVHDTVRAESLELPMIDKDTAVSVSLPHPVFQMIKRILFNYTRADGTEVCVYVETEHGLRGNIKGVILNGDELKRILYQCAKSADDMTVDVSVIKLDPKLFAPYRFARDCFMFTQSVAKPTSFEQIAEAFRRCEDCLIRRNIALHNAQMPHRDVKITVSGLAGFGCEPKLNSERTVGECKAEIAEMLGHPQTSIHLVLNATHLTDSSAQIRDFLSDDRQDVLSLNLVIAEPRDPIAELMSDERIVFYDRYGSETKREEDIKSIGKIALKDSYSGQDIAGFLISAHFIKDPGSKMAILLKLKEILLQEGTVPTQRDIALSVPWQIKQSEGSLRLTQNLVYGKTDITSHIEFFGAVDPDQFAKYADYITHTVFPWIARICEQSRNFTAALSIEEICLRDRG